MHAAALLSGCLATCSATTLGAQLLHICHALCHMSHAWAHGAELTLTHAMAAPAHRSRPNIVPEGCNPANILLLKSLVRFFPALPGQPAAKIDNIIHSTFYNTIVMEQQRDADRYKTNATRQKQHLGDIIALASDRFNCLGWMFRTKGTSHKMNTGRTLNLADAKDRVAVEDQRGQERVAALGAAVQHVQSTMVVSG